MPLAFDEGANYLPPGIHRASVSEVHEVLVAGFDDPAVRQEIFDQWTELTAEIRAIVQVEKQWLNGSFVSRKLTPGDLDLATFLDGDQLEALPEAERDRLTALLSGPNVEAYPLIDSFAIVLYAPGHPVHEVGEATREAFESTFFARDSRIAPPIEKGFVEVAHV